MAESANALKYPGPFAGDDHARLIHPSDARGVVTIAGTVRNAAGDYRWHERKYEIDQLPAACRMLAGCPSAYISHQRFIAWRRVSQLFQLGAFYQDIDYHKTKVHAGRPPREVATAVLMALDHAGIPDPWILSTGRGLLLLWPHEPVPRQAVGRWRHVQKTISRALHGFGVDSAAASDAARVFRITGSLNLKQPDDDLQTVQLLHRPAQERWSFGEFADEILPYTRAEVHSLNIERANRKARGQHVPPTANGFSGETLWEARLTDLQRLLHHRWWGDLPEGQRDLWLFLTCNAMSWLAPSQAWSREFFALAREAAGWPDNETRQRMASIFNRAEAAARGEKVEWNGYHVDPRYRFRTQTLIDWLEISDQEIREAGLSTIIPEHMRRERHREQERERRRKQGAQEREAYLADTQARRDAIQNLRAQGYTQRAIATELGVGERTVRLALKGR